MKILLINVADYGGGAAKAALRLTKELNNRGVIADLYVGEKRTDYPFVKELPLKRHNLYQRLLRKIDRDVVSRSMKTTNHIAHSTGMCSIFDLSWINDSDYDIVHLHWICGIITIKDIATIKKKIIWTMHDSWPCCGAEHHPNVMEDDTRWKYGYNRANKPETTKGFDICRFVWGQKEKYISDKEIHFIAPSIWEKSILKESALFRNSACERIPNIVPLDVFFPRDRQASREKYGIRSGYVYIGYAAAYNIDDPRTMKGIEIFLEALSILKNRYKIQVIFLGPVSDKFLASVQFPSYSSGYIQDENKMAELYSCCDCYVNSSPIENLSYTIYESLACGTPVTAFDTGGNSDLIHHMENGYLARCYEVEDLASGIEYCLKGIYGGESASLLSSFYDTDMIVDTHLKLYCGEKI